ncbi:MAG: PspC domain-containing protein, partial [Chitinophagaceae bacterium]
AEPVTSFVSDKKLFRDLDDAMLAGVCAGLGHYLNIESRWVRIIALATIFLGGAGILAYLILWIAIPRAITRSEKMEMKGESTNLFGYKRSFEEELAAFKEKMQSSQMNKRSGNVIGEVTGAMGRVLNALGRGLSKIIAGIMVVFGFAILIGLIICLAFSFGFWDSNDVYQNFPLSIVSYGSRSTISFAAFIILFIPILALVLFAIRVAFNKATLNKGLSFALLIIWLGGVSIGVYYVAKISSEFKEHAELVQSTPLLPFKTYVIDAAEGMVFTKEDSAKYKLEGFQNRVIVDDSDDYPFRVPRNVHINIEKSETGNSILIQNFESQGKTFNVALQNARNIDYNFTQKGYNLTFAPRLILKDKSNWRNQEVHLTLKVPVGTRLLINDNIYNYLYTNIYNCNAEEIQKGEYKEWIMTEDGIKCKADLDNPNVEATPE